MKPTKDTPKETWSERFTNFLEGGTLTLEGGSLVPVGVTSDMKAFIAKELAQAKAEGAREVIEKIRPFELVEDCEPDCTPIRHALHEGSWKAHLKLERILTTLREDYKLKEEPCSKPTKSSKSS